MSDMRRTMLVVFLCVVFELTGQAYGQPQSPDVGDQAGSKTGNKTRNKTSDSAEAKRAQRMRKLAGSFDVFVSDARKKRADLREKPIFSWSNPQRDAIGGMLYLWTHEGRPHATIGIWTYDDTAATDSYEVQSLSAKPFRSQKEGAVDWSPRTPGVEYKKLPTAGKPSKTKSRRLGQMRQLAKKYFAAELNPRARGQKLRLLPSPVYRYDKFPKGVMDGAMFSFAQGTDPEVFLILEAHDSKEGPSWYYAFANQTSGSTEASFKGKVVWDNRSLGDSFQMVLRRPDN